MPAPTLAPDAERWFAQIDTFCVDYNHSPGHLAKEVGFELWQGKQVRNPNGEHCGWLAKEISPYFVAMQEKWCITLEGQVSKPPNKFKVHIRFQVFAAPADAGDAARTARDI